MDAIAAQTVTLLLRRIFAHFIGATLAALTCASLSLMVFDLSSTTSPLHQALNWILLTIVWANGVTAVVGLPWHALAYSQGWRQSWAYWPAGALAGAIIPTALTLPFGLAYEAALYIVYASLIGGLTGILFWFIRRPDRDPPNPATSTS
jgi:hypothetical protein